MPTRTGKCRHPVENVGLAARVDLAIADLTYSQVAAASGVSRSAVGRLVQGGRTTHVRMRKIAAALGVNGDWLISGIGSMRDVAPSGSPDPHAKQPEA